MKRTYFGILSVIVVIALVAAAFSLRLRRQVRATVTPTATNVLRGPVRPSNASRKLVMQFANLPLSFEENRGQVDSQARFLARGPGYAVYLGSTEAVLLHNISIPLSTPDPTASSLANLLGQGNATSTVRLSWLGANPHPAVHGDGRQVGTSNYFIGNNPRKWRRHIAHYDRVEYQGLYPGVDLVYHGDQQHVEFDYDIAPGANLNAVQIGVGTPSIVGIAGDGRLNIQSGPDRISLLPPVAYQEIGGRRQNVAARYVLKDGHRVGFDVPSYDHTRELIIDPVLVYSASWGTGSNASILTSVAVDTQGNAYVAGTTCDPDYPVTVNAFQSTGGSFSRAGCYSTVVSKIDPTGSTLLYSTYVAGTTDDSTAGRILVDSAGELYVSGTSAATDFPTTTGSYQPLPMGGTCDYNPYLLQKPCTDGTLFKLSADGSTLLFSTYLGGERADIITALALDSNNNIYVTGVTNSTRFPMAGTPAQPTYGGGSCEASDTAPCFDAFVAKFNSDASQLLASTYLGGSDNDFGTGIYVDPTGSNVYVTGNTRSSNFPTTSGAFQTSLAGTVPNPDVFVTELNGTLSTLQYSTLIGGSESDLAFALAVDSAGNAYVTGTTASSDFPHTTGAFQTTYAGPAGATCPDDIGSDDLFQPTCGDVFVAKLNPTGTALVFSTFLGGTGNDIAFNLGLDSSNNIWITGDTNSADFPFSADAYYQNNSTNLFLSEISADGSTLMYSSPLSANTTGQSLGLGLAIDSSDDIFVAGQATQFSPTPGAFSTSTGGGVFLAKYAVGTSLPGVELSQNTLSFNNVTNSASAPQTVMLTNNGSATLNLAISLVPQNVGAPPPAAFTESDNCGATVAAGASCTIGIVYLPTNPGTDGGEIQILDNAPNAPHIIVLSGTNSLIPPTSFLPPSLSFPGQQPGVTSASQTANLNADAATASETFATVTTAPVLSGPNASEFTVDATNCQTQTHDCGVNVTFTPAATATGTRTARLSVATNAPDSPATLALSGTVATGPFALITPASPITLNPTVVNTTLNSNLFVRNTGGANLVLTGFNYSGANPSEFVVSGDSCAISVTIPPQSTCVFNLAFTPTAAGTQSATITLADNETAPGSVTVSGTGANTGGPEMTAELFGSNVFTDTTVGQTTSLFPATISVFNNGSGAGASAHITSLTPSGDFQIQTANTGCAPTPFLLAGGSSCSIAVVFAPTAAGLRTGSLTIQTDEPGTPAPSFTFSFSGTGVLTPTVTLTPSTLNFGSEVVNGTTAALPVLLSNNGNGTLNLSGIAISGPFSQTNTCGTTVVAGGSCTFSIKFSPTAAGPVGGLVTFNANASAGTFAIGLSGPGASGAAPQLVPTTLTFGNQPIDSISAGQTVTLSNAGSGSLNFGGLNATENFTATSNCPATLAAGASCAITVKFAPTIDTFVGGATPGAVYVNTATPGSPFSIAVSGTATQSTGATDVATITSVPNPSTFGQSVTFTCAITSTTAGTPTGTVIFSNNGVQIGPAATLNAQAKATTTTSSLPQGNDSMFCIYSGDSTFAPATSSGVLQVVSASSLAATTTSVVSSLNPSTVGASVTFTSTTTSTTAGTITGTVDFLDGTTVIGAANVGAGGVATFTTSSLAAGPHSITAQYAGNLTFAGSTSAVLTEVINAAVSAPTLTMLSQNSAIAGSAGFTLTLTGTNFIGTSVAQWNGVALATTYVSATQLTATVPTGDLASAVTVSVTVFNSPSGGTTAALTFTINNPVPTLTMLSQNSATAGSTGFTLMLTGTSFVTTSVAQWNGAALATTYVSATQVNAVVPTADLSSSGSASVTVFNPTPGGGTSGGLTITINAATVSPPMLTSLSPASAIVGGAAFTLTVNGTGFLNGSNASVVQWNAASLTTTYVSATQLTASVPASDIAAAGMASVTVFNPTVAAGVRGANRVAEATSGTTSNALTFSIVDFSVSSPTGTQTVTAGGSAMFTISTAPVDGTFPNPVTFAATGLPTGAMATFLPQSVTPGASTIMRVTTTMRPATAAVRTPPLVPRGGLDFPRLFPAWLAALAFALLLATVGFARLERKPLQRLTPLAALILLLIVTAGFLAGCPGGFPNPETPTGTPAGTYPITVTGTSGTDVHSTIVMLTVQ